MFLLTLFICLNLSAKVVAADKTSTDRWTINPNGSITWIISDKLPHNDHIEMSGLKVSTVVRYGIDENGAFKLNRSMIWPMLRTIPNDTHGSLMRRFEWDVMDMISVNHKNMEKEKVTDITLNGLITVNSEFSAPGTEEGALKLTRILFPSVSHPMFCESYTLKNGGKKDVAIEIPDSYSCTQTDANKGVYGSYKLITQLKGNKSIVLKPGEEVSFEAYITGYKSGEKEIVPDMHKEIQERENLVKQLTGNLVLNTPDQAINTMFAFAKIRGCESIYDTKGGLMHGPGGESYYAAVWANDQAEYINPFFPFTGYEIGNKSAFNSFKHFARFINDKYEPIPSSIIAEGDDIWNGARDRGDAAMIAYGASRYALARGDKAEGNELWPLIEWCLEYCKRKINKDGVVASNTDELENRFPSGDANLCTSSLYYDALLSAVYLGKDLGKPATQLAAYKKQAAEMKQAINNFFGATVEGFDTYRYYKENDILRSWICVPLTMGINDRKEGTLEALFSPRLWTDNGLLTQAGSETFWDRSTLYALRGVYQCGEKEKATDYLKHYSSQRLLGEHVPYAIEAWPEGNQRHLSAESALYCRIITEGLFGIRPTGLHSFSLTPQLPEAWNTMKLENIQAFGHTFTIDLQRKGKSLDIQIRKKEKTVFHKIVKDGSTVQVRL